MAPRMAVGNRIGVAALAIGLVVVAGMQVFERPQARSELVQSMDSLAWPVAEESPLLRPVAATTTGVQAAPVESLISGLEARLAAHPDDAKGWALLAQSYAFIANEEAVERAVGRAVELGVDEQSLRERVQGAQRSAQPRDWVDQNLRANRP